MTADATGSRSAKEEVLHSSRRLSGSNPGAILLLGVGESSDAYHMSTPHPEGLGARMAMQQAWNRRDSSLPNDYVNLHGTATKSNDGERRQGGVRRYSGAEPPCKLDQGATGHLLGAAGNHRGDISILGDRARLRARQREYAKRRPRAEEQTTCSKTGTRKSARALSNSFGFAEQLQSHPGVAE